MQRLHLFSKLDIRVEEHQVENDCCDIDLKDSENDLELVENCFQEASNLSLTEKSTLYFISGYVAKKEKIECSDSYDTTDLPECEFTLQLSRGGLKLPPLNLYDLSRYSYSFFKKRPAKCCTKLFLEAFHEIHTYTGYNYQTKVKLTEYS